MNNLTGITVSEKVSSIMFNLTTLQEQFPWISFSFCGFVSSEVGLTLQIPGVVHRDHTEDTGRVTSRNERGNHCRV